MKKLNEFLVEICYENQISRKAWSVRYYEGSFQIHKTTAGFVVLERVLEFN